MMCALMPEGRTLNAWAQAPALLLTRWASVVKSPLCLRNGNNDYTPVVGLRETVLTDAL